MLIGKISFSLIALFIPIAANAIIIMDDPDLRIPSKPAVINKQKTTSISPIKVNTQTSSKTTKTTTTIQAVKPKAVNNPTLNKTQTSSAKAIDTADGLPPGWPWRGVTLESSGTADDISKLAAMNVNAIAIQLNVRQIAESKRLTPKEAWDDRLAWADQMVQACKKHGIVCNISMFQFPIDPALRLSQDSPEYWSDPNLQKQTVELVGRLAEHFKDIGDELGAYDILSEPLVRSPNSKQQTPKEWPALQDAIIRKIRQIDPNRYIVVTPGYGGMPSSFIDFKPLNYPKLVYSAHMYSPHGFTHQGLPGFEYGKEYPSIFPPLNKSRLQEYMRPVLAFQKKYNALVYIGEFSAIRWASGGDQYVSDVIDIFDDNQLSWMYFSIGYHGWNPSYDNVYTPNASTIQARSHFVGENTPRWKILKNAFKKNKMQKK